MWWTWIEAIMLARSVTFVKTIGDRIDDRALKAVF